MPTVLPFVFAPEDEKQFFAFLAPFELTLYPDRVPPDWDAPRAEAGLVPALAEPAYCSSECTRWTCSRAAGVAGGCGSWPS